MAHASHINRHHGAYAFRKAQVEQSLAEYWYSLNAALFRAKQRRGIERRLAWCLTVIRQWGFN
jgi:hypothetical protein